MDTKKLCSEISGLLNPLGLRLRVSEEGWAIINRAGRTVIKGEDIQTAYYVAIYMSGDKNPERFQDGIDEHDEAFKRGREMAKRIGNNMK